MSRRKQTKRSAGTHTVQVDQTPIQFDLYYSRRKTIAVRVNPDCSVQVNAPSGMPYTAVADFVFRRGRWIIGHIEKFEQRRRELPAPRRYVSGEVFQYMGTAFRLEVVQAAAERVQISGDSLIVSLTDTENASRIQVLIERWYCRRAGQIFSERLLACYPNVALLGAPLPPLRIRTMKTCWGSCSSKGKITLNLHLVQLPVPLIDYVILHELCHLIQMNHSPRFWALMDSVLPDWKARRKELKRVIIGSLWL